MAIRLNFVNDAKDAGNPDVVLFSRNVADDPGETVIAWIVIRGCTREWRYSFDYPEALTVAGSDSWGNFTPQLPASPGQQFSVHAPPGPPIAQTGAAASAGTIELVNRLPSEAIDVLVHKDGRLFAARPGLAPGCKAAFAFRPTLWIGTASGIEQGEAIDAATLAGIDTEIEIPLHGVERADIVMTGGGKGRDAEPLAFELRNIVPLQGALFR